MTDKEHLWVAGILALVGVPFAIAGGIIALWVPQRINQRMATVAALPLTTVATFAAAGDEVLVLGEIADRTPAPSQGLLIYQEYRQVIEDGETEWQLVTTHTPDFWVAVPDGLIKVEGNYQLEQVARDIQDGDRRTAGFTVGHSVLVLGQPTQRRNPPTIQATLISADNKESYLEYLRASRLFNWWFGGLFLGLGILLTGAAGAIALKLGGGDRL